MSDLREAYSATSLASLEWDENREKAIDRVAAAGKASPLGIAIWKSKYMLESRAYSDAIRLLTAWYREKYNREQSWLAEKIAEQCLYEFIFDFCASCQGAGEVVIEDLKVSCGTCQGSRVRRHSNSERASRMKISWSLTKALTHKLQRTICKVFEEDRTVNLVMTNELREPG